MTYDIIVIDPPWAFSSNSVAKPGRNARRHYACMSDDEIAALDIPLANPGLLFVWTTAPMLVRSIDVIRRWGGLKYATELSWPKNRIGTGFWARNKHETCLLWKRGKFPCPKPAPFPSSLILGDVREHSRKPEWLQDRIDEVWPTARKLEMFARERRLGWDSFGNEVEKFNAE